MAYDLHIIRSDDWSTAGEHPILLEEVEALVTADPELAWSEDDYIEMEDESGKVARYFMICWKGEWFSFTFRGRIPGCGGPGCWVVPPSRAPWSSPVTAV